MKLSAVKGRSGRKVKRKRNSSGKYVPTSATHKSSSAPDNKRRRADKPTAALKVQAHTKRARDEPLPSTPPRRTRVLKTQPRKRQRPSVQAPAPVLSDKAKPPSPNRAHPALRNLRYRLKGSQKPRRAQSVSVRQSILYIRIRKAQQRKLALRKWLKLKPGRRANHTGPVPGSLRYLESVLELSRSSISRWKCRKVNSDAPLAVA